MMLGRQCNKNVLRCFGVAVAFSLTKSLTASGPKIFVVVRASTARTRYSGPLPTSGCWHFTLHLLKDIQIKLPGSWRREGVHS